MKVAITVWDGHIAPVFDVTREARLLEVRGGRATPASQLVLSGTEALQKVEQLVAAGVEALVCGAISQPVCQALEARGVRVLGFVAGPEDEVVHAFLAGDLPTPRLSMPGCRRRRCRGGRGGAGGPGPGGGPGHRRRGRR